MRRALRDRRGGTAGGLAEPHRQADGDAYPRRLRPGSTIHNRSKTMQPLRLLTICLAALGSAATATAPTPKPIEIMVVGVYHMANPDGTDDRTTFRATNSARLSGWFDGDDLFVEARVKSKRGYEGDLPRAYNPLVTDANVAATVSLYWDFFVIGGDVTIDASGVSERSNMDPAQYVRLSGSSGLIFDLNYKSALDPESGYFALPEPITLTPGRYLLQANTETINGGDDRNWFAVTMSGVDSITHRDVPDGGTTLALLAGGIFSIYTGRRLNGRNWLLRAC
ncbi:MAG: VPDSG-CTERM sorting domain-containing protein [Alphaproteobacteria bacterium]|nr:MAG: VPDSG-CTERM sorting domain-containing protein [Alphaproteobacteria bacterium]